MADVRYSDCPYCGRANVPGYPEEKKENKYIKGGAAGYGAVVGGLLGGPLGAAVGAGLGKVAGDLIADDNQGKYIDYNFRCPNQSCEHTWTRSFRK